MVLEARWLPSHLLARQDPLVLEAPWRRSRPLTRLAPKAPSFPLRQLGRQDPQVLEAPLRQSLPSRLPTRQVLLVQ